MVGGVVSDIYHTEGTAVSDELNLRLHLTLI